LRKLRKTWRARDGRRYHRSARLRLGSAGVRSEASGRAGGRQGGHRRPPTRRRRRRKGRRRVRAGHCGSRARPSLPRCRPGQRPPHTLPRTGRPRSRPPHPGLGHHSRGCRLRAARSRARPRALLAPRRARVKRLGPCRRPRVRQPRRRLIGAARRKGRHGLRRSRAHRPRRNRVHEARRGQVLVLTRGRLARRRKKGEIVLADRTTQCPHRVVSVAMATRDPDFVIHALQQPTCWVEAPTAPTQARQRRTLPQELRTNSHKSRPFRLHPEAP
jgi:hypothetical protein